MTTKLAVSLPCSASLSPGKPTMASKRSAIVVFREIFSVMAYPPVCCGRRNNRSVSTLCQSRRKGGAYPMRYLYAWFVTREYLYTQQNSQRNLNCLSHGVYTVCVNRDKLANIILSAGVAFAFLYPPFSALYDPDSWIGYFPSFTRGIVPDAVLLHSFGALEAVIALWILGGRHIFLPSLAATAILAAIVICDWREMDVVFRDVSIALASAALAVKSAPIKNPA